MSVIAIDCEMVGDRNNQSMLARVSIVDSNLSVLYNTFVKPLNDVYYYRTQVSGITARDLMHAEDFYTVQATVRQYLLNASVIIGHRVKSFDLPALHLTDVPDWKIRDTSSFPLFKEAGKQVTGGSFPSLKFLADYFLNESIQGGAHSPVEDARTCMKLYLRYMR